MKKAKFISGGNYFRKECLDEMCKALEGGDAVEVGISCIGHTRNNMEQENYREALEKKYGDRLIVKENGGVCSYSYTYSLK